MKTRITFRNVFNAFVAFLLLSASTLSAQTHVYNETTLSGMFIDGDGAAVANPVSDGVNSSANCARSGTGTWKKIEYFPNYTPVANAKLYFSIYNPNNAGPGQVQFEYTTGGGWKFGDNVTYVSGSATGWKEYSIDLTAHIGNIINKIIIFPAGGASNAAFIDNIYFGTTSTQTAPAQNPWVYNDVTGSGIFFQGNGSEVANPLKDSVNSSDGCAQSSTSGTWQQIQYFPTYTPSTGDKLHFSVYSPNGITNEGQLQFEYTSGGGWKWGGNLPYETTSLTGWKEYSVDIDSHVGNTINKIILMPAGGASSAVYVDNIYFGKTSTLSTKLVKIEKHQLFVAKNGQIQFTNSQDNAQLAVFDLSGKLIIKEKISGFQSKSSLNKTGIYIAKIKSDAGVSSQKIVF